MAKAAKNNKSITLEGVEIYYHEQSDTLNIVSKDPDLPKGGFFMKVKEGTPTDISLRNLFAEKTGNSKPLEGNLCFDLPQETLIFSDSEMKEYGKYTFPIGVTKDQEKVCFDISDQNFPTHILISGVPGCGKTVITEQILRKAEISGIHFLRWLRPDDSYDGGEFIAAALEQILDEDRDATEPAIVVIDSISSYFNSMMDMKDYDNLSQQYKAQTLEFEKLLRLARSKNITFILTEQRPTNELMHMLTPHLAMNIVGAQDTVSSATVLGTNAAVKLKNGQFIVKTDTNETTVMKAYAGASFRM